MTHNPPVCCIRGVARILSALMIGGVLLIFVGEADDSLLRLTANEAMLMVVFWTAVIGLAIGWRAERLGGSLAVGGVLLFCGLYWFAAGSLPKSWYFALLAVPGVLFLIAATLENRCARRAGI
jgi:peptidoglycan/LPS O-acetylase OafA/YrhL